MDERRSQPRMLAHSPVKMSNPGTTEAYYGYVENICSSGMGVVAIDNLIPGNRYTCSFFIDGHPGKITSIALVVHRKKSLDSVNYYGFSFDYLTETDRSRLEEFLNSKAEAVQ